MSALRMWWFVGFALLLSATPSEAQRKRYSVESFVVDAAVANDGSMQIEEAVTYRYRGDFTFGVRDIPRSAGVRIEQIAVSENGIPFRQAGGGKAPGTFVVDESGGPTIITWYYTASNETRTFLLRYRVAGEIRRYTDVAELYYKFLGDGRDRPIGRASVTVRFPRSVSRDDLRAWAHGPLYGTVDLGDGTVTMNVAPLPADQFWEGRILFPASVVPSLPVLQERHLDQVLAEESVLAAQANEDRRRWAERQAENEQTRAWRQALVVPFTIASLVLALTGIVFWSVSYARHGRPHDVQSRTAPGVAPSTHSPALVEYLLTRTSGVHAVVATLLDLAHRGYLTVRQTERTSSGLFGEKTETDYEFTLSARPLSAVQPFERDLLEFMLHQAGSATVFSMGHLKKAASSQRSTFRKWFHRWMAQVKESGQAQGWFEPSASRIAICVFFGLLIAIVGVLLSIISQSPAGLPAAITGVVVALASAALRRRTVDGQRLYQDWYAFKRHLRQLSRAGDDVRLTAPDWGRYVALSVVFGLHKKLLAHLQPIDGRGREAYPNWFVGHGAGTLGDSMSSFSASMNSMVSSVSTAMTSATGAGGHSSGGGGGGGGGGGVGAG